MKRKSGSERQIENGPNRHDFVFVLSCLWFGSHFLSLSPSLCPSPSATTTLLFLHIRVNYHSLQTPNVVQVNGSISIQVRRTQHGCRCFLAKRQPLQFLYNIDEKDRGKKLVPS